MNARIRARVWVAHTQHDYVYRTLFLGHQGRFPGTPPIRDARKSNMSPVPRPGR
jgi:hypothetical protein